MDNDAADRIDTPDPEAPAVRSFDETVVNVSITIRGDLTANQLRSVAEIADQLGTNFGHPIIHQKWGNLELELNISDRVAYSTDGDRKELGRQRYVREGLDKQAPASDDLLTNRYGYDDEPF